MTILAKPRQIVRFGDLPTSLGTSVIHGKCTPCSLLLTFQSIFVPTKVHFSLGFGLTSSQFCQSSTGQRRVASYCEEAYTSNVSCLTVAALIALGARPSKSAHLFADQSADPPPSMTHFSKKVNNFAFFFLGSRWLHVLHVELDVFATHLPGGLQHRAGHQARRTDAQSSCAGRGLRRTGSFGTREWPTIPTPPQIIDWSAQNWKHGDKVDHRQTTQRDREANITGTLETSEQGQ